MRLVREMVWWERIEVGSLILGSTEAMRSQQKEGATTRDGAASDPTQAWCGVKKDLRLTMRLGGVLGLGHESHFQDVLEELSQGC